MTGTHLPSVGKAILQDDNEHEEEEDDYLTMSLPSTTSSIKTTTSYESSLARRKRLARTAEERGYTAPKAIRERQARESRDAALNTSLIQSAPDTVTSSSKSPSKPSGATTNNEPFGSHKDATSVSKSPVQSSSKGLAMMRKLGFTPGQTLGAKGTTHGLSEPIGLEIKEGRSGLGADTELKRKIREEWGARREEEESKRRKLAEEEDGFRERVGREREEKRLEGCWWSGMRILEGFVLAEEEEDGEKDQVREPNSNEPNLEDEIKAKRKKRKEKKILLAPMIQQREEQKFQNEPLNRNTLSTITSPSHMSHMDPVSLNTKNPVIDTDTDSNSDLDSGTRRKRLDLDFATEVQDIDDDDDDDPTNPDSSSNSRPMREIPHKFNSNSDEEMLVKEYMEQPIKSRLALVIEILRNEYRYCFWCKVQYESLEQMNGDGEEEGGCPGLEESDHD